MSSAKISVLHSQQEVLLFPHGCCPTLTSYSLTSDERNLVSPQHAASLRFPSITLAANSFNRGNLYSLGVLIQGLCSIHPSCLSIASTILYPETC